jgi:transcription antitermination factor NusG
MTEKKHWYAVYTRSRAEKKVLIEMEYSGIEAYLPLHRKIRQWSDRKKWVEMPLIPGYLFVNIGLKEYDKVLKTMGVVTFVRFEGKAAIIPSSQIEFIRKMLEDASLCVEVIHQIPEKGDKVMVTAGPLIGLKGTIISVKGKKRVAVEIEQLNLSLTIEIQLSLIEIIKEHDKPTS